MAHKHLQVKQMVRRGDAAIGGSDEQSTHRSAEKAFSRVRLLGTCANMLTYPKNQNDLRKREASK